MAGPAIRAYELARALAPTCAVTLAAPAPSAAADPGLRLLEAGLADYDALLGAAASHDVVVAQLLPARLLTRVASLPGRLVVDLYNPTVVEVLEATRHKPPGSRARVRAVTAAAAAAHLAAADFALCASEAQRDLWLGVMAAHGLLDSARRPGDVVGVVPFGVPDGPAPARPPGGAGPLRTAFGLGAGDRVLVWGGGVWDWLDAPTAIRALELLPDDVHLAFLGLRRPALAPADEHRAGAEAVAEAERLGPAGRRVHLNDGWVPYDERGAWLADADLGVSAHPDHLEARFAFRTRILDYLWAGLPVVATGGDALSGLVAAAGAGRAVPAGDPRAFAAACTQLLDDPGPARAAARRAAGGLRWERVAEPLRAYCTQGAPAPASAARRRVLRAATLKGYAAIARETLATDGAGGLAARVARNAARAARRT